MHALDVIHRGRLAADELVTKLLGLPEPIAKAAPKSPLSPEGFDAFVLDVLGELQDSAGSVEQKAIATYLKNLDKRWDKLTPAQRTKTIANAAKKYLDVTEDLIGIIPDALYKKGPGIVAPTKAAAKKQFKLPIEPTFNLVDEWAVAHVAASQALYVTDANKTRVDAYSTIARDIVSKGLEQGLDRKQIAADLEKNITLASSGRTNAYWQMLASVYVSRARNYSVLSGFDEAGIEAFQFVAILDEVTTEICRFMHGQVFQTSAALGNYAKVNAASDPEEVKEIQPWVQTGTNANGDQALYYNQGGKKRLVARVDEPGFGTADKRGTYSKALSPKQLQARGMSTPPLHGHCRSTIVPVFEAGSPHAEPPPPADASGAGPVPPTPTKGLPADILAKLPPDIQAQVRPMPTAYASCVVSSRVQKGYVEVHKDELCNDLAAEYTAKLNALPKAKDWNDTFVLAPIEGWPTNPDGTKADPLGFKPNLSIKKALTKPQEPVPIANVISKDKIPQADKKKVLDLLMQKGGLPDGEDAVVVGKLKGKYYVFKGDANGACIAAHVNGDSTIMAHVADIDEKLSKPIPGKKKVAPPVAAPPYVPPPAAPAPPPKPPPPPPVPKPTIEVAPPTAPGDAANILHQKDGSQRGSNDGGFYTGADGVKRYVKFYPDETQAHAEHLANQIYNDLGLGAPKSQLFKNTNGKTAYSSELFEGAKTIQELGLNKERANKVLDGFAADVLTGNWDAVGMGFDNVMQLKDGRVVRIDSGGTFLFRAKQGRKLSVISEETLNDITEWEMFNAPKNPNYSKVFQTAGVDGPEDDSFKNRVKSQISSVLELEKQSGGWAAYVEKHAGGMKEVDKKATIKMLESRSRKLQDKLIELDRPKPKAGDVAQFSTVLPHKDLKVSDVPEHNLFQKLRSQSQDQVDNKSKTMWGESISGFRSRTEAELQKATPAARKAINGFTNGTYDSIRETEERGSPDKRSNDITSAYDKVAGTRTLSGEQITCYRGITVHGPTVSKLLDLHMQNETFGLGKGNTGATSSSTWAPHKTFGGGSDPGSGSLHIVYKIRSKTGIAVETNSQHQYEREILLSRNARYRTTGLSFEKGTKQRVLFVECEEIGDDE